MAQALRKCLILSFFSLHTFFLVTFYFGLILQISVQRRCVNAEETRFGVVVSDVSMSLKPYLLLGLGPVF